MRKGENLNRLAERSILFLPEDDGEAGAFVFAEEADHAHPRGECEQPGYADEQADAKRRVGPSFRMLHAGLLRPAKRSGEARDRRGQVLRVGGDDVQQLAREDGVDRFAVAVGEAFQGQDLEARDAHFQVGQAEELGDGVGEVGTSSSSPMTPITPSRRTGWRWATR